MYIFVSMNHSEEVTLNVFVNSFLRDDIDSGGQMV